jgi:hypothetical protein
MSSERKARGLIPPPEKRGAKYESTVRQDEKKPCENLVERRKKGIRCWYVLMKIKICGNGR